MFSIVRERDVGSRVVWEKIQKSGRAPDLGRDMGVLARRFDSRTKLKYLILYWFSAVKTRRAGLKVVVWILVGIEDHLVMFSLCL